MSTVCTYKVKVKGLKQSCYALYGALPGTSKEILKETGTNDIHVLFIEGTCNELIDSSPSPWNGDYPVKVSIDFRDALKEGKRYCNCSIKDWSKMFNVEIWCNYCDKNDNSNNSMYKHYLNGKIEKGSVPSEILIGVRSVQEIEEKTDNLSELLSSLTAKYNIKMKKSIINMLYHQFGDFSINQYITSKTS